MRPSRSATPRPTAAPTRAPRNARLVRDAGAASPRVGDLDRLGAFERREADQGWVGRNASLCSNATLYCREIALCCARRIGSSSTPGQVAGDLRQFDLELGEPLEGGRQAFLVDDILPLDEVRRELVGERVGDRHDTLGVAAGHGQREPTGREVELREHLAGEGGRIPVELELLGRTTWHLTRRSEQRDLAGLYHCRRRTVGGLVGQHGVGRRERPLDLLLLDGIRLRQCADERAGDHEQHDDPPPAFDRPEGRDFRSSQIPIRSAHNASNQAPVPIGTLCSTRFLDDHLTASPVLLGGGIRARQRVKRPPSERIRDQRYRP